MGKRSHNITSHYITFPYIGTYLVLLQHYSSVSARPLSQTSCVDSQTLISRRAFPMAQEHRYTHEVQCQPLSTGDPGDEYLAVNSSLAYFPASASNRIQSELVLGSTMYDSSVMYLSPRNARCNISLYWWENYFPEVRSHCPQ